MTNLLVVAVLALAACAPTPTVEPTPLPTMPPASIATPVPPQTITDIAVSNPDFSTLVAALQAASLAETLMGEGPFTVFAPTNEAFAKLPAGTLEELLKPENKQKLTEILLYHLVSGQVLAADVVILSEAETALGQKVLTKVMDGKVDINESQVIITDIITSNGVIHVIDAILLL